MSGDLPLFPSTLQYLALGYSGYPGNHFTGTLRLNKPIELWISDNLITDVVILDSSLLVLGRFRCYLDNNPLLGNPNIAGLTMCTKNGLYSAELLPVTKSILTTTAEMMHISSTLTSSMGTVSLVPEVSGFAVTLGMMVRSIISAMVLSAVFMKTPFKREFKRMMSKGEAKTTTSALKF